MAVSLKDETGVVTTIPAAGRFKIDEDDPDSLHVFADDDSLVGWFNRKMTIYAILGVEGASGSDQVP